VPANRVLEKFLKHGGTVSKEVVPSRFSPHLISSAGHARRRDGRPSTIAPSTAIEGTLRILGHFMTIVSRAPISALALRSAAAAEPPPAAGNRRNYNLPMVPHPPNAARSAASPIGRGIATKAARNPRAGKVRVCARTNGTKCEFHGMSSFNRGCGAGSMVGAGGCAIGSGSGNCAGGSASGDGAAATAGLAAKSAV
jgi:hypothetical protein